MQRLKALEKAHEDGHWEVAKKLLVTEDQTVTAVSLDEIFAAQKAQLLQGKILRNEEKLRRKN